MLDLVTQGLLGAACAQVVARSGDARKAACIGLLAGLLPDADTLMRSPDDPLLFLDYHRHFSHALLFIPVGALFAALALWWPFRRLGIGRIYVYALAGYALAGLLDACTSYGTHLWWPFATTRVAWSIVSIVDPVVSMLLLIGVVHGLWRQRRPVVLLSLALAALYLALGFVQQQRATDLARALAEARGHDAQHLLVKPTFGNIVLWRAVYIDDAVIYADGIRPALFSQPRVYSGEAQPLIAAEDLVAWAVEDPVAVTQARRFAGFAEGFLVRHPTRPALLGDARFSVLPTSLAPLWGIEISTSAREAGLPGGVDFVSNRKLGRETREVFMRMLWGH